MCGCRGVVRWYVVPRPPEGPSLGVPTTPILAVSCLRWELVSGPLDSDVRRPSVTPTGPRVPTPLTPADRGPCSGPGRTHIHMHTRAHTCTYALTRTDTDSNSHTHAHTRTDTPSYTLTRTHTHTHAHTRTDIHIYTHVRGHTHFHTYTHTRARTCTQTHTCTLTHHFTRPSPDTPVSWSPGPYLRVTDQYLLSRSLRGTTVVVLPSCGRVRLSRGRQILSLLPTAAAPRQRRVRVIRPGRRTSGVAGDQACVVASLASLASLALAVYPVEAR